MLLQPKTLITFALASLGFLGIPGVLNFSTGQPSVIEKRVGVLETAVAELQESNKSLEATVASLTIAPSVTESSSITATVTFDSNLRAGPGTEYSLSGVARKGETLDIVGGTTDQQWYKLANGSWIYVEMLESRPSSSVPVITDVAKATIAPTAVPLPTSATASLPLAMSGVDNLGIPYKLSVPDGLLLDQWKVREPEKGGLAFEFSISTPGKKFNGGLTVIVTYYNSSDEKIGGDGIIIPGAVSGQDRNRTYTGSFMCDWGSCPDIVGQAAYYALEIEIDLIDFP